MKPKEIIPYIEGAPYIGEAPVGERGITVGEAILVKTMNKNGFTAEQIAASHRQRRRRGGSHPGRWRAGICVI